MVMAFCNDDFVIMFMVIKVIMMNMMTLLMILLMSTFSSPGSLYCNDGFLTMFVLMMVNMMIDPDNVFGENADVNIFSTRVTSLRSKWAMELCTEPRSTAISLIRFLRNIIFSLVFPRLSKLSLTDSYFPQMFKNADIFCFTESGGPPPAHWEELPRLLPGGDHDTGDDNSDNNEYTLMMTTLMVTQWPRPDDGWSRTTRKEGWW